MCKQTHKTHTCSICNHISKDRGGAKSHDYEHEMGHGISSLAIFPLSPYNWANIPVNYYQSKSVALLSQHSLPFDSTDGMPKKNVKT